MASTINVLIQSALDYVATQNPIFFQSINRTDLEAQMQTAFYAVLPADFDLNTSVVDFEGITLQLVQALQEQPAWKDLVTAGVGQTLLRDLAAGLSYLQFSIIRATQTAYLTPGTPRAAVYNAMNFLGVEPRRKVPAKIKVRLTIPDHADVYAIPAFTTFTIANVPFFTPAEITFSEFELSHDVELTQGTLFEMSGTASGNNYETIEIGYENFNIAAGMVFVWVNAEQWKKAETLRPWMLDDKATLFITRTLDTGNVSIQFGNGLYGKKLRDGDGILIRWAETLGTACPAITTSTTFSNQTLPLTVTGEVLSGIFGADDPLSPEFYQRFGPRIRASNQIGYSRASYTAQALQYPRVRDAIFRGQAEIAPGKRNWMNISEVTILTVDAQPFTSQEWADFTTYLDENGMERLEFVRNDPILIPVNLHAEIFCQENTDLQALKAKLIASIRSATSPKQGSLGYSWYGSDIDNLLSGYYLDEDQRTKIAYVDNVQLTYDPNLNSVILGLPGIGITGDDILASFNNYVQFKTLDLDFKYTTRRVLNRRDLATGLIG